MALLQWKQFSREIGESGAFTGSLDLTGSIFLNGRDLSKSVDTSLLSFTGSTISFASDVSIKGGLNLDLSGVGNAFSISADGNEVFSITNSGSLKFTPQAIPPPAEEGSIYFGTDRTFYFGV